MGLSSASKRLLKESGGVAKGVARTLFKPVTMVLDSLERKYQAIDAAKRADIKKIQDTHGFSRPAPGRKY